MASALVRNQMCTCPRLIKFICAIIICSFFGLVSSDTHLSDRAKVAFRTIGRPFRLPLHTSIEAETKWPPFNRHFKNLYSICTVILP